ncbi:hypothetical protein BREVNS_2482 [Brevinematales bacterium NS]|jgi:hypothetical protein|nr:hypothetical protein BREVNS_2482 [Brevinematales bacterium NS]
MKQKEKKNKKETLARVFSSLVCFRGYAPETPFFPFTRAYLSFFVQRNRFIYYVKEHFYTIFCFFTTFLRPSHIRAKVSKRGFCMGKGGFSQSQKKQSPLLTTQGAEQWS